MRMQESRLVQETNDLASVRKAMDDIQKGIRPIASATIRVDTHCTVQYQNLISSAPSCLSFPRSDNHRETYIFKHAHLAEVIRAAEGQPHDEAVVQAWFNGKMFGYSEEAIAEYIEHLLSDDTP